MDAKRRIGECTRLYLWGGCHPGEGMHDFTKSQHSMVPGASCLELTCADRVASPVLRISRLVRWPYK